MFALKNVKHVYGRRVVLDLFERIEAQVGEQWALLGPSGSGKTTLLHILAGLLKPHQGDVLVANQNLYTLTETDRDRFRGQHIGIVFQQFHLLPVFTVLENLLMVQYMSGVSQDRQRALNVLASLDMADRVDAYPAELSFGQHQRVAIARAVMNRPALLLVDEPTSALDDERSHQVLDLLIASAQEAKATLVVSTHDKRILSHFDKTLSLSDRVEEAL